MCGYANRPYSVSCAVCDGPRADGPDQQLAARLSAVLATADRGTTTQRQLLARLQHEAGIVTRLGEDDGAAAAQDSQQACAEAGASHRERAEAGLGWQGLFVRSKAVRRLLQELLTLAGELGWRLCCDQCMLQGSGTTTA